MTLDTVRRLPSSIRECYRAYRADYEMNPVVTVIFMVFYGATFMFSLAGNYTLWMTNKLNRRLRARSNYRS